jgi:hypothetical protein
MSYRQQGVEVPESEWADLLITYLRNDPKLAKVLWDSFQEYREGLWESSEFVNLKWELLAKLRAMHHPQLLRVKIAFEMIESDHAFSKHVLVHDRVNHSTHPSRFVTRTLHKDDRLEMIGHGHKRTKEGVWYHPFWLKRPGHEDAEVDIATKKYEILVAKGSLLPLD